MSCHRLSRLLMFCLPAFPLIATQAGAQAATRVVPDLASAGAMGEEMFVQSASTGMMLVVVRDGQVFIRGYGETAPGSHELPNHDSVLRLCSLTKIFTADVLAKLVTDGTVRLDDPLQRYAAAHDVVPKRGGAITLEDLATHTSGLPRELGNAPPDTPHFTFPNYATRWRWLPNQRLKSTPGTAALYSNVAFDLLSDALAVATHEQYARLLAERTLQPLQMRHTTLFPSAEQCRRLLVTAYPDGPCTSTEETAGSSGLYSNADDMVVWLRYLLANDGAGASAQAVQIVPAKLASEKGLDHAGEPTGVGLGWIHVLPLDSDSHIVEKTGGGAGFETYIAINHARHTALFLAATNGLGESHLNLYNAANKVVLAMAGLPPLPEAPAKVTRTTRARRGHRRRAR